jgi:hypothetical protein
MIGGQLMKKFLPPWQRIFIYFVVFGILSYIGEKYLQFLGYVVGVLFAFLLELYTHIKEDTNTKIADKLKEYNEILTDNISSLHEFESLKSELAGHYGVLVKPDELSSQLLNIVNIRQKGITKKITPTLLIKSSVEPDAITQDPGLSFLFLNSRDSHDLFVRSFDFVKESYWGTTFSSLLMWENKTMDAALETQKRLVQNGKEVRRVFISNSDNTEVLDQNIEYTNKQRSKYKINCRHIDTAAIISKSVLSETWRELWPYYYGIINGQAEKTGKIILISPDFGIIDKKIFISYLLDSGLNEIGAAVYYDPSFLEQVTGYFEQLFEESFPRHK